MKKKKKKSVGPKIKKVKGGGLIKFLQKSDYKGYPVWLRMVDGRIFEYFIIYENELYTGYNVITPKKGKKKLTEGEIAQCGALIFAAAVTTIDTLIVKDELLAKNIDKSIN